MASESHKRVVVTGADGLLGWHLRVVLGISNRYETIPLNRAEFADDGILSDALEKADAVVHLAAQNRGDDDELYENNISMAKRMASVLRDFGRPLLVLHSSSIHIERFPDSSYSRSKRQVAEILGSVCRETGGTFCNLVFPHLFGENGRPYYNSVVSTFCAQLVSGEKPVVERDGDLELLHCQDASDRIVEYLDQARECSDRIEGCAMKVSELERRLDTFWGDYEKGVIPELRDQIGVRLFNTLRSYCGPSQHSRFIEGHSDHRGNLVEFVKERTGGQVFYSSTKSGVTRGNHFHRHKVERFLVVSGRAEITMRRLLTEERRVFSVDGDRPQFVDIPTLWTHNITSTGDETLVCLFWVNEIFDPSSPDTYSEEV